MVGWVDDWMGVWVYGLFMSNWRLSIYQYTVAHTVAAVVGSTSTVHSIQSIQSIHNSMDLHVHTLYIKHTT
jgi:hypothetical protein